MDHQLGRIALINWQGRRNRRVKPGISLWTLALATCAVIGALMLAGQALGLLRWGGVWAGAPTALLVIGLSVQLLAIARAALTWIAG